MQEIFLPIQQDMPGFNPFFGSWICRDDVTIMVDPGPASTAHRLIDAMETSGIKGLDYVLLSHIHIDHGGALCEILKQYPEAKAVCHEKGIPHLVDPTRLYDGSVKVLGDVARTYGPPKPVEKERLIPHTACAVDGLDIIETPGHAVHHLSFTFRDRLYAGEAAGNYFIIDGQEYLRPATPPRFFLNVFSASVDRLLALEDLPIRYAHVESAATSHRLLELFKNQLQLWESVIGGFALGRGPKREIIQDCIDQLLKEDPSLAAFAVMDRDTQEREKIFMANSVNGFLGYLDEKTGNQ